MIFLNKIVGVTFLLGIFLTGCSGSSGGQGGSASSSSIKGTITNVTAFSDVSISITGPVSPLSILGKVQTFAAKNVAVNSDGSFLVGVEHGCYQLEITKPNYRSRAIENVCVDGDTPTKDLGNVGLSVERRFIMTAAVGDLVIMAGGQNSDGYWTTVDVLNITDGSLSIENLSKKRGRGAGVAFGTKAYFAGGEECDSSNSCNVSSLVEIYDSATKVWATSSLSSARAELSAGATNDGYIVFAGGFNATAPSSSVDVYNTNTDTWTTATLPVARFGMSSVVVGNKIYFAGGSTNISGVTKTTRVDIFEPSTGVWTVKNMSVARRYFQSVSMGNKILFAGGQTDCFPCGVSSVVDIYDINSDSWSTASLSKGRELLVAATDGNVAVFAGGEDSNTGGETDVVDIYNSGTGQWTTGVLSLARTNLAVGVSGGKAFFVGGNYGSNGFSNVIDIFNFATLQMSNSLF